MDSVTPKELFEIYEDNCRKFGYCGDGCPLNEGKFCEKHIKEYEFKRMTFDELTLSYEAMVDLLHDLVNAKLLPKDVQLKVEQSLDDVNHPLHYTAGSIECIDAMESAFGNEAVQTFCILSAFKYLWRYDKKESAIKDIKKAQWYLNKYIELVEELQ